MSVEESVSPAVSGSCVSKKTREPSVEAPVKNALDSAFPPVGPVDEHRRCDAPERSYTSFAASVSEPTSTSSVCSQTFDPSAEAPSKNAS